MHKSQKGITSLIHYQSATKIYKYVTITADDKIIRKVHWLESATAILTDKGWKFDMLHSTRIKSE